MLLAEEEQKEISSFSHSGEERAMQQKKSCTRALPKSVNDVCVRPRLSGQARNERFEKIAGRRTQGMMEQIGDRAMHSISHEGEIPIRGGSQDSQGCVKQGSEKSD